MTKKKIASFGAAGLAALLIGFVLFAYYSFTHNFHIAISDQQRSDIETAFKGSLGEAIFSGQRAQVLADSTIEGKRGLDALLAHAPSDNKGEGLIEAYQKGPQIGRNSQREWCFFPVPACTGLRLDSRPRICP